MSIGLHEGFDHINVARGIINLTILQLESIANDSSDVHVVNKCKLLIKAFQVAIERNDNVNDR